MKIAFIGHKGYPSLYGGVEKVVEEIVNRLADKGHTCIVYSRSHYVSEYKNRKNVQNIIIKGLKTKRLDTLSHTFLSLIDVIKRDVDVVAINSFGNAILNFIPKIFRIPVAVHLHGFEWGQKRFSFLERKILLRLPLFTLKYLSDVVTTVSIDQNSELKRRNINNIFLPNGINVNSRKNNTAKDTDEKYLLYVGRIAFQKGIEYLIQAFNICSCKNIKLKIVGGCEHSVKYYNLLLDLAKDNDMIEFLGYKYGEELNELYKKAYVVIIPSETEECPMVLLEALAFNKCIIASKIPGIYNIADDNVLYFENKNYFDLASIIIKVTYNKNIKEEYELKVSKIDMGKFDWKTIVNKYEELYHEIILKKLSIQKHIIPNISISSIVTDIPENKDHSLKILKDIIQPFGIKQKLYYNYLRPRLTCNNRKRIQKIVRSRLAYNSNFIEQTNNDLTINKNHFDIYPNGYNSSVILTHDVDSQEGFNFIPKIIELSEKYKLKSCWYIIPYKYKIDEGIINLIKESGDEIGIHGFNHDGKLFLSKKIFDSRAKFINEAIKKYDAKGFRSPMVHRNLLWLQELNIMYDASCFDYDPFQPFPGGTHTIWPFQFLKLIELPYTIPQDHTIFYELNQSTIDIWIKKIEWLIEKKGMILGITHPDYLMENNNLELYEELLQYISGLQNSWKCLPYEMAEYWKENHSFQTKQKVANKVYQ